MEEEIHRCETCGKYDEKLIKLKWAWFCEKCIKEFEE